MHIDVKRLEQNGWIVEIDEDEQHIMIHPEKGNNELFRKVCELLGHRDVGLSIGDAERITDHTIHEVQKTQIMNLVD